jgi:hypothetical protein
MLTFMVLLIMGGLAFVFLAYQNYRRNKWQGLEALHHLDLDEEEEELDAYQDEYGSSCGRSIPKGTRLARSISSNISRGNSGKGTDRSFVSTSSSSNNNSIGSCIICV